MQEIYSRGLGVSSMLMPLLGSSRNEVRPSARRQADRALGAGVLAKLISKNLVAGIDVPSEHLAVVPLPVLALVFDDQRREVGRKLRSEERRVGKECNARWTQ